MYRVSLAANATFAALFAISLIGFLTTYALTRRGIAFTVAFSAGVILEVLGYAGRVMSWKNQWDENGFLMQICCLTIAPAFLAAGIYLCLRRIVYVFGPENSRISPEMYTRIVSIYLVSSHTTKPLTNTPTKFIPCDVISLILQAVGGAMASIASHNGTDIETGDNIMIAGLAFQVFTLLIFIGCSLDFAYRVYTRNRTLGADAFDQSDVARKTRNSVLFKGLLASLAISTILIFWRSVFRVAELSGGWEGELMGRQDLFIGFEGVMIIVACLVLNVFHPSVCFKEMMEGAGGFRSKKGAVRSETETIVEKGGKSEVSSDGNQTA